MQDLRENKLISIREMGTFTAIDESAWETLVHCSPGGTVFQSFSWLTAWWQSFGEGALWVLTAWEKDTLVGAAPLFIDPQGTVRFVGDGHADYGAFLFIDEREDILQALLEHLFARPSRWEALELSCIRAPSALASKLRERGAWSIARIPCPRVLFSERPAASLLGKESLRRHAKKLKKEGRVEVHHFDAAAEIEPFLEAFFRQHRERWAFTTTPSLFANPNNRRFYQLLAAKAVPGGPMLFTVVSVNGSPVAMHFGFRSEGQIIWYKPTYDPRLSNQGPGEVLLAELIRRAQDEGAQGLDFTRGDERFKLRFASEIREVISFSARASRIQGIGAHCKYRAREALVLALQRIHLRAPVASFLRSAHAAYRVLRERGLRAAAREAHAHLKKHAPVCVKLYVKPTPESQGEGMAGVSIHSAQSVAELLELLDLNDPEQQAVLSSAPAYLAVGAKLWVAVKDGQAVSCGWELKGTGINVTEIGGRLEFPESSALLMEFCTFSRFRKQGYYGALLKGIPPARHTRQYLIYALRHNIGSVRAIEKAGFKPLADLHRSMLGELRYCAKDAFPAGVRLKYLAPKSRPA